MLSLKKIVANLGFEQITGLYFCSRPTVHTNTSTPKRVTKPPFSNNNGY